MIEHSILANLLEDEDYCRAIIPFLKEEYFTDSELRVFQLTNSFVNQYNARPTKEALRLSLENIEGLSEKQYKDTWQLIDSLETDSNTNRKFLIDETEKFAKEKALINALRKSIAIVDDQNKKNVNIIPELLQNALSVCFDPSVGSDYFEDVDKRFEIYHRPKKHLPLGLRFFDMVYNGGLIPKSMMIIMAPTGAGKTMCMTHFAAHHLSIGKNVIYFSMEMSEDQVMQRVDENLMNVTETELMQMSEETFRRRVARIREKTVGRLLVKEFPSGSASAAHFKNVIEEARIKKNFIPDVIYVDYLNICASSRVKMGGTVNSYFLIKNVAEELRGLAQQYSIPLITATQTNRDGMNSSDVDLTDVSESIGITHTGDYICALITSEELERLGQIVVKQLKNRYGDVNTWKRFVIGIDRSRMKLFDAEQDATEDLSKNDEPTMDRTNFGSKDRERSARRNKFDGFK